MKRFIDLRGQICVDEDELHPEFAWYDTIIDKFEEYQGTQVWLSWEEFAEDYLADNGDQLDRYRNLTPEWAFSKRVG